jgi:phosphoribosyl 1,2-cyclic phosphate phosphodiesterase
MESLRITILGSGTSHGIPMIACDCPVCTSPDPRDKRTRASIYVQKGDTGILVDTSPELRLQCLANNIRRVDAVLFTHHHADHIVGLDDLRRFNELQQSPLTCYGNEKTVAELARMFVYAFNDNPDYPSTKPELTTAVIDEPTDVAGIEVIPIPLQHGPLPILGFRVGSFAYCTDVSLIPESSWPMLEDLDVLVLTGLRRRPHPTHFNIDQAVEHARLIGAQQTLFTHIAHELMHQPTCDALPDSMSLCHDGMVVEVPR